MDVVLPQIYSESLEESSELDSFLERFLDFFGPLSWLLDLDLSRLLSFLDLSFFDFPSSELDELLRDLLFLDFLQITIIKCQDRFSSKLNYLPLFFTA